jgi:glycosyltransferase involved in cell wall biosynthesis
MSRERLRILWCGEASYLNTGYAVYAREILGRLYNTNKYDIAEFACYGEVNSAKDTRRFGVPWRFYGNFPCHGNDGQPDPKEAEIYNSSQLNQFGEWRFNEVALDFKPHIVWDIRDNWMHEHHLRSPFRRLFHWCVMPTCDSHPQQEQWISNYIDADSVFAYEQFGKDVLERESNGRIQVVDIAPPGFDDDAFKPVADKKEHKRAFHLPTDAIVIGTVMRNQKRKLYPDVIETFKKLLDKNPSLAHKTYLYIHTSYPDVGWDIPRLVRESGVGHKIFFTYICKHCGFVQAMFFSDARAFCPQCGSFSVGMPDTQKGLTSKQLGAIYNLFDLYLQYSICEGFGIPMVEAAACGVPIVAVDYSAMENVVRKLKGYPVRIQRMFREPETHAYRVYPDNDHLLEIMESFCQLPEEVRLKKGRDAYLAVKKHYTWEKTAKVWENFFDGLQLTSKWTDPPIIHEPCQEVPDNLSPESLVQWSIANILGEPDLCNSYMALRMTRDLNYGASVGGTGGMYFNEDSSIGIMSRYRPFHAQDAMQHLAQLCQRRNYYEQARMNYDNIPKPPFIQMAKPDNREMKA